MSDPSRFFNKTVIIKKMPTSGHVRRFTATATVDAGIQEDSRATELMQADYGEIYIGYFDISDPVKEGRTITEATTGAEYIVKSADIKQNPITGTAYLEAILLKDSSKQDSSYNY